MCRLENEKEKEKFLFQLEIKLKKAHEQYKSQSNLYTLND